MAANVVLFLKTEVLVGLNVVVSDYFLHFILGFNTRNTRLVMAWLASVLHFSRDTLDVIFDSRFSLRAVLLSVSVNYF